MSEAEAVRERRELAIMRAVCSLLLPGLGQLGQRRYLTAFLQFGSVATYLVAAARLGGRSSLLLALLWNLWSVIDAYVHEP